MAALIPDGKCSGLSSGTSGAICGW